MAKLTREERMTAWMAEVAIRRRGWVYTVFGVLLVASLALSQRLGLVVEPEQLLGEDNPVASQFFEIEEAFGFASTLIVAVTGDDRDAVEAAAREAAERLRADAELAALFRSVRAETESEYPLRWGLMLADEPEDAERVQRMLEQRSLLGLLTTLNDTLEDVVLADDDRFATNQDQWSGLAVLGGFERLATAVRAALAGGDDLAPEAAADLAREAVESVLVGERYAWSPTQGMLTFSLVPAFDMLDFDALYRAVDGVDAIAQSVERDMEGVRLGLGGEVAWAVARHQGAGADTFVPTLVALALIVVLFFFSFTRLRKMLLALGALIVGILLTMGAIVLTIGHVSMITSIFAVILMGLGIDFGIHLVSNYDDFRLEGLDRAEALRRAMQAGGAPIMLGGVTTAVAFASLSLSGSPAVREFGFVAGMGVLITLAVMLLLFPALLLSFGGKGELRRARWRPMIDFGFMGRLGRAIERHPWAALAAAAALTAVAAWAIPRNVVDYDPMNNAPRAHRYTATQRAIMAHMEVSPFIAFATRASVEDARELAEAFRRERLVSRAVAVSDLLPPADDVSERLALIARGGPAGPGGAQDAAELEGTVRTADHVREVAEQLQRLEWNAIELGDLAVAGMGEGNLVARRRDTMIREIIGAEVGEPGREVFQRAIAAVTADADAAAGRLAALDEALAPALAAQQRHMAVTRAPTVDDLPETLRPQLVSADGSRFLVTVIPTAAAQKDSATVLAFHTATTRVDPGVTGSVPLYVELTREIFTEATRAGVYVALAVFALLFLAFRRIGQVLLAFTMVVLGLAWMFGLLPLAGTHLALTAGLVFPLLIGIGTDDALHILHRYRHEGGRIEPTLRYSGKAVLLTTVTTMLAFGSLAVVGEMATIAAMGSLLFVGLGTCFLATVIVLPACLSLAQRRRNRRERKETP